MARRKITLKDLDKETRTFLKKEYYKDKVPVCTDGLINRIASMAEACGNDKAKIKILYDYPDEVLDKIMEACTRRC